MEIPPGEDSGGGAFRTLRHPAPDSAQGSTLNLCAAVASFCACSGEYGGIGATAGSLPRIWQQEELMPMQRVEPPCATTPQHAGCPAGIIRRQADTGVAAHMATTASINNAPLLPQFKVESSQTRL
jgi:hypothetical protein